MRTGTLSNKTVWDLDWPETDLGMRLGVGARDETRLAASWKLLRLGDGNRQDVMRPGPAFFLLSP